jgi:hypothetical protein
LALEAVVRQALRQAITEPQVEEVAVADIRLFLIIRHLQVHL